MKRTKEEMSMKKLAKWVVIVAVISMVGLISAPMSYADEGNRGAWSWGVSEGALVDFNDKVAVENVEGTIMKIVKVPGAPSYLQYNLKAKDKGGS